MAERLQVGRTFIKKMLRLWRERGDVQPQPHGGGAKTALGSVQLQALRQQVAQEPDATLGELRHFLAETDGVLVSKATICRALQRVHLRRKKRV